MNVQHVLTHLIRAGRDALHLEKTLKQLGYENTPYFNLYGEISDAVYGIVGEDADSFDESITCAAMHDCIMTDEECASRLALMCVPDESSVPEATRKLIEEAASARGIEFSAMVNLILSEWAAREVMLQCMK